VAGTHQFGNFPCRRQPHPNAGACSQYYIPVVGNSQHESAGSMMTNQHLASAAERPNPTAAEAAAIDCLSPPDSRLCYLPACCTTGCASRPGGCWQSSMRRTME